MKTKNKQEKIEIKTIKEIRNRSRGEKQMTKTERKCLLTYSKQHKIRKLLIYGYVVAGPKTEVDMQRCIIKDPMEYIKNNETELMEVRRKCLKHLRKLRKVSK